MVISSSSSIGTLFSLITETEKFPSTGVPLFLATIFIFTGCLTAICFLSVLTDSFKTSECLMKTNRSVNGSPEADNKLICKMPVGNLLLGMEAERVAEFSLVCAA